MELKISGKEIDDIIRMHQLRIEAAIGVVSHLTSDPEIEIPGYDLAGTILMISATQKKLSRLWEIKFFYQIVSNGDMAALVSPFILECSDDEWRELNRLGPQLASP